MRETSRLVARVTSLEFGKGVMTMLDPVNAAMTEVPREMAANSGWFIGFGIVLASLGIVSAIRSFASTAASIKFFGWLLLTASVVEFMGADMVGHWTGFFLHLLAAILLLVTGVVALTKPAINVDVATLVMSMFFLIGGLYQVAASWASQLPAWGWQSFDGVITSLMGIALLIDWPISGLKAIGVFVGIDLILSGCSWYALAVDLGKM